MDYHALAKMRVADLRELAKEKTSLTGVTGLHKEELVDKLADALGIEKPHKLATGEDKPQLKSAIAKLKKVRLEALESKDADRLRRTRKELKQLRRKLRHEAKEALKHAR